MALRTSIARRPTPKNLCFGAITATTGGYRLRRFSFHINRSIQLREIAALDCYPRDEFFPGPQFLPDFPAKRKSIILFWRDFHQVERGWGEMDIFHSFLVKKCTFLFFVKIE